MDFGFTINAPRAIYLDRIDPALRDRIIRREPTTLLCIGCGSCETRCPFGVGIVERMEKARELFAE